MKEYKSVQNWFFNRKKPYTEQTRKVYTEYMEMFCKLLRKTPDEIVNDIKNSQTPISEMRDIVTKLANYMNNNLHMKIRSIHQRLNALNSFWRANGIRVTPEIMQQIHHGIGFLKFRRIRRRQKE